MQCRVIPAFEHALLVRISQLLITRLQNLLDPAGEPAAHTLELKVVLRVARTTLKNFYLQLHTKCGVFIEALIAGRTQISFMPEGPQCSHCIMMWCNGYLECFGTDSRPI